MVILLKNKSDLTKIINSYFVEDKERQVAHIPSFSFKDDESEKIYIHNNDLYLSDKLAEFLKSEGFEFEEIKH